MQVYPAQCDLASWWEQFLRFELHLQLLRTKDFKDSHVTNVQETGVGHQKQNHLII